MVIQLQRAYGFSTSKKMKLYWRDLGHADWSSLMFQAMCSGFVDGAELKRERRRRVLIGTPSSLVSGNLVNILTLSL